MIQFQIQPDSDIPASKQLFDQIRFAIASRQYPPGHRLPSTRQLATITGLHRNTISKVYQQLEESGLVESMAGSGIYVKAQKYETGNLLDSPLFTQYPDASSVIHKSFDELLKQGLTLSQIKELLLTAIDWRLRSSAQVLVTVPIQDLGAGELILQELEKALAIPVQLVPMEELAQVLSQTNSGTVVSSRYFIAEVESIAAPYSTRVIPVDIYDYSQELALIKKLPSDTRLGIVSLSPGILTIAEILIHSLRGDDLLLILAQASDRTKVLGLVRSAQTIMTDPASYPIVKQAIITVRDDLIRPPDIICSENYIGEKSINLLKRELGLG
ncbi:GntR family transcriptional regulator [Aphanothece sacrum]|uniref:GntR family transcriptional regulator n=1 Tax=Aphanothece sacrum FPU1 TaxID=1920663 RepID=A0A401IJR1_APHSA|nr:GntR family transcriptional regulator [Aphanothece sacrum]GBF81517.1 GntR family transcriptional regulator [Aphanothece sacrum FPU1]GBF86321.1 transcriptional regulator, GntR family [Aphanothece sacrum FPU3]